jgi:ABC-type nitrate/sulfonate/bicarbonate transport system permease component
VTPQLRSIFSSSVGWVAPIAAVLAAWEMLARLGVGNEVLFSSPSESLEALGRLLVAQSADGYSVLLLHVGSSMVRFAAAFSSAGIVGVALGVVMGLSRRAYCLLDPLITVTMPIPGIAWAPLFMLWLGFGAPAIIAVGAVAAFFPVVRNTCAGVSSIDVRLLRAARSLGADNRTVLLKVCLPGAMGHVLAGLSLGFARGWRAIIAAEMIGARLWGIGFMIMEGRDYLAPAVVYGGIGLVALAYLLMETIVVRRVERITVERWGMVSATVTR